MAKNQDQRNRERDKRLQKTYRITLERYNQILLAQGGKCAICGRRASDFSISLNVDHEHFKIHVRRTAGEGFALLAPNERWYAYGEVAGKSYEVFTRTKEEAVTALKNVMLPASVRGLLCPGRHGTGCNTKLGRADSIPFLEKALQYLKNPPARGIQ